MQTLYTSKPLIINSQRFFRQKQKLSKRIWKFFALVIKLKHIRLIFDVLKSLRNQYKSHKIESVALLLPSPASWSSGNAFVSGAEGLRVKSRAG